MAHVSNEKLLTALRKGPYSNFREYGNDDWRNPIEKNPGLSLSLQGWYDHRTEKSGSLYDLAKKHDLPIVNSHRSDRKGDLPQKIWDKSKLANHPDSPAFKLVKSYLTGHRKIPSEQYIDLLKQGLLRLNEFKGERMLVYPTLTPQNFRQAIEGKVFSVNTASRGFSSILTAPNTPRANNTSVPKRQSPAASSSPR